MTLRSALPLSLAAIILCLAMPAPALAAAVPCASLGLDPEEEGEGILERFFVETDGVGGLGCWMHPHPNGKDAIFTPFSWGRTPNPGKQGLIDEAMAAITETSDYLRRLGTVDSELYMLLTDLERPWTAEAHWIVDRRCWMEVTPSAGWGAYGPDGRWEYKSIIAHEIAHCFFKENFEGYNDEATDFDAWWDESGAEFMMAQVYPADNSEHYSSARFDLDGTEFMQEYHAVVLLQHFANLKGVPDTLEFLRTAWRNGRARSNYVAYLDGSGLDTFFHDFTARHYSRTVLDPGGGNMPAESAIVRLADQPLDEPFGVINVSAIEPRRLVVVGLTLPPAHSVVVEAPPEIDRTFRASLSVWGEDLDDWAGGVEVRATCDSDVPLALLLTTLRADGVASQRFRYSTRKVAECDCQDYETLDACLVGNWEMDPPSRGLMFGEDGSVGGRVALTFRPSGVFLYQFSSLSYHGASFTPSGLISMRVDRTYNGNIRGCARTMPAGQRLDRAIPMKTEVVADGVRRSTTIWHREAGTTTNKTEDGLEAWFWPHKSTYYRCEGDTLHLEKRVFTRTAD